MWDFPGSGIKPGSPAFVGRFLTTGLAGKSQGGFFIEWLLVQNVPFSGQMPQYLATVTCHLRWACGLRGAHRESLRVQGSPAGRRGNLTSAVGCCVLGVGSGPNTLTPPLTLTLFPLAEPTHSRGPEAMTRPLIHSLTHSLFHSFIPSQGGRERTQRPSVQREEQKLFIKSCSVTLGKALTLSETQFSHL